MALGTDTRITFEPVEKLRALVAARRQSTQTGALPREDDLADALEIIAETIEAILKGLLRC